MNRVPPTPFPPGALRTGRARCRASGSPHGLHRFNRKPNAVPGLQVSRLLANEVLTDMNLNGVDMTRADLRKVHLSGKEGEQPPVLIRADLTGADLSNANLNGADLRGADLMRTSAARC